MAATSSVLCVAVAPQVAAVVVLGGDTTDDGGDEDALLRLAAQEVRRYTYATGGNFPTIQHLRTPDGHCKAEK